MICPWNLDKADRPLGSEALVPKKSPHAVPVRRSTKLMHNFQLWQNLLDRLFVV